jgi:hypothetical protein
MSPRIMTVFFADETEEECRHKEEMGRWRFATGPRCPRRSAEEVTDLAMSAEPGEEKIRLDD